MADAIAKIDELIISAEAANARAVFESAQYRAMRARNAPADDLRTQANTADYWIAEATRLNTHVTWRLLLREDRRQTTAPRRMEPDL